MRKKLLFVIILLITFKDGICQSNSLIKVTVRYVDFDIETAYRITCEIFEQSFSTEIKQWVPSKKEQTDTLRNLLHEFKPSEWPHKIDTRAVILWERNGLVIRYCIDNFGYFSDGITVYRNDKLFEFLKSHLQIN